MGAGIILQARVTSKRFPNKCLALLGETTVLDYVIDACNKSGLPLCIAIPVNKTNDVLEAYIKLSFEKLDYKAGQPTLYRGFEEDVTTRFIRANYSMGFDPIVRICSDCPYLAPEDIKLALEIFKKRKYFTWLNHVQVCSAEELKYADDNNHRMDSRQHVGGQFMHDTVEYPEDIDRFNNKSLDDPTIKGRLRLWGTK